MAASHGHTWITELDRGGRTIRVECEAQADDTAVEGRPVYVLEDITWADADAETGEPLTLTELEQAEVERQGYETLAARHAVRGAA